MNKIIRTTATILFLTLYNLLWAQSPIREKICLLDSFPASFSGIKKIDAEFIKTKGSDTLMLSLFSHNENITTLVFEGDSVLSLIDIQPRLAQANLAKMILKNKVSVRLEHKRMIVSASKIPASLFRFLLPKMFNEVTGNLSAYLQIDYSTQSTEVSGWLLPDLAILFERFSSKVHIEDSLPINQGRLLYHNYKLYDSYRNTLQIDGEIGLKYRKVELAINSDRFFVSSVSKKKTNPLEAKGYLRISTKLSGVPGKILHKGAIEVLDSSQLTFYPVASQPNLVLQKDIVEFVNPNISSDDKADPQFFWEAYHLDFDLKITPNVTMKLVTHTRFEDYVTLTGTGNLKLSKKPANRVGITGDFIVQKGKIIDGRFLKTLYVSPNSQLNWNGVGLWPELKILSKYKLTASVERLFGQESATKTDAEKMLYRRRLPFIVTFKIAGRSDKPEFSFQIQQPPEYKASLNGRVHEKLNAINQSPYLSFLQGSSLISTKRFVGTKVSDTNVSSSEKAVKYLAKFLTWVARRGFKGYNLRAQYYSYDDYGEVAKEPTWREFEITFGKNFFNNRFNASVGGIITIENAAQQEINSFADRYRPSALATYFFNPRSTAYLQMFSISNYTGILDRRVRETGVRFGVSRSFNHFAELWRKENINSAN